MIYTCTFSPAIDYIAYVDDFTVGALNRTRDVHYLPGGKGINVSRLVARFGEKTTALGFVGGFTGQFITQQLEQHNIHTQFIETSDITRINVKLKGDVETEINGPTPAITPDQFKALLAHIKHMTSDDVFVLSGAVPASLSVDALLTAVQQTGATIVADISGPLMHDVVRYKPLFIKPNVEELSQFFNVSIKNATEAIPYARQLIDRGATYVVVTLGGDGALFVSREHVWHAQAPAGQVVNTVGAGDSVVAGIIAQHVKGTSWKDAFTFGVAAGSATAFSLDLCELPQVETLVEHVVMKPIKEDY